MNFGSIHSHTNECLTGKRSAFLLQPQEVAGPGASHVLQASVDGRLNPQGDCQTCTLDSHYDFESHHTTSSVELEDDDLYRMYVSQEHAPVWVHWDGRSDATCHVLVSFLFCSVAQLIHSRLALLLQIRVSACSFAMTCTTSPGAERDSVPAPFMNFLLNEEDENDLDWLDAEAECTDLLLDASQHMSPDGPHAHTRLRVHGQDEAPHIPLWQVSPTRFSCTQSCAQSPSRSNVARRLPDLCPPQRAACSDSLSHATCQAAHECVDGSSAILDPLQETKFSHSQLQQLYAQVQAHAQLVLQTFLLASQGEVSVGVQREVDKLWGWSDDALKDGPLRDQQARSLHLALRIGFSTSRQILLHKDQPPIEGL